MITKIMIVMLLVILSISLCCAAMIENKNASHTQKQKVTTSKTERKKANGKPKMNADKKTPVSSEKSQEEWKKTLTPEQFRVMREKGTEAPFQGKYWNTKVKGIYKCAACGM